MTSVFIPMPMPTTQGVQQAPKATTPGVSDPEEGGYKNRWVRSFVVSSGDKRLRQRRSRSVTGSVNPESNSTFPLVDTLPLWFSRMYL